MKQLNMYQDLEPAPKSEVVFIEDVDMMANVISDWHKKEVATLEHMLTIPEGVEVVFGDDKPIILTGDIYTGFLTGISISLLRLGTLPFVTDTQESSVAQSHAAP